MGFFSKIKDNFKHGSVDVSLVAPASITKQDARLDATVTLTNKGSEIRTVSSVGLRIVATTRQTGTTAVSFGSSDNNSSDDMPDTETIAESILNQEFTLSPGESKSLPIVLGLQATNAQGQAAGGEGVLGDLASMLARFSGSAWTTYELVASANVKDIALDPSYGQTLQIV